MCQPAQDGTQTVKSHDIQLLATRGISRGTRLVRVLLRGTQILTCITTCDDYSKLRQWRLQSCDVFCKTDNQTFSPVNHNQRHPVVCCFPCCEIYKRKLLRSPVRRTFYFKHFVEYEELRYLQESI